MANMDFVNELVATPPVEEPIDASTEAFLETKEVSDKERYL